MCAKLRLVPIMTPILSYVLQSQLKSQFVHLGILVAGTFIC